MGPTPFSFLGWPDKSPRMPVGLSTLESASYEVGRSIQSDGGSKALYAGNLQSDGRQALPCKVPDSGGKDWWTHINPLNTHTHRQTRSIWQGKLSELQRGYTTYPRSHSKE